MAIDFPGTPSNGAQHTASGITWTWDGTTWKADGVTGSYSLPTASSTVLGGVKIGSGISISTGTISSTLQSVVDSNATCTSEVFVQNKLYFSNNFANLTALNAVNTTTYHGMFAHVHAEGHGYFAHAGAWTQLIDTGSSIGELGDVTISGASNGQVLKYNGSAWVNAADATGGSSYTNSDVDTHLNISSATSGQILSWNGSDYDWVADQTGGGGSSLSIQDEGSALSTAATTLNFVGSGVTASGTGAVKTITIAGGGTSYTNSDVDTHLNQSNPTSGYVLSWNGSDYAWVAQTGGGSSLSIQDEGSGLSTAATTLNFVGSGVVASGTGATKTITIAGYTNSDVDTHLNTSSASSSQILSWNGSDYAWVADQTGSGSGLASRTTGAATASSLANDASANLTITAAKTYALHKIQTSHAAWVTLYTDTTSRTQDASRTDSTDPVAGSGVIAEVITSDGATQKITPAAMGYNDDGTPSTNAYVKVVNKSGSTANLTVTLHFVSLEA